MPQENAKKIKMSKSIVFSQFIEGLSEGIYIVGATASIVAFFFGVSIAGAPILVALAGAGIVAFVTIAVASKYSGNKKRYQALKTAAEREKRAIDSLTKLEETRLQQLIQEQNDLQAGKKIISLDNQDALKAEIKLLKVKISAYNQKTAPPKAPTPKSDKLATLYERFYNGLSGFKRAFTLRNVAGTSLLLLGFVVSPPLALAFTFVLGSILFANRIISRNNEKKIPQETKSVNASAEEIEKANIALRTKIVMSNRQTLGVNETPNISTKKNILLNNDVNKIASSTVKKNKFITSLQIFEGVFEAAYVVGSIFSILSFFFGLTVIGSPLLIAAGAIGGLFFLGASIASKYRLDAKSHEGLTAAVVREEKATAAYNELHPNNTLKITDIPEKSAKESFTNRAFRFYEYAYQGFAAFKRGFTVRGVIGTTILLTTGLVLNAPGIIAATLVIGILMAGSRVITKAYEKNKSDKINKINTAAERIEKKNIETETEKAFHSAKNKAAKNDEADAREGLAIATIVNESISRMEPSQQAFQEKPLTLDDDRMSVVQQTSTKEIESSSYTNEYNHNSFFTSQKKVDSMLLNIPDNGVKETKVLNTHLNSAIPATS